MRKLLVVLIVALVPSLSQARIGWTLEECKEQYGKVVAEKPLGMEPERHEYTFEVGTTNIKVWTFEGAVYHMIYETNPLSAPWTKDDVMQILLKNSNNSPWKLDKSRSDKDGTDWYIGKSYEKSTLTATAYTFGRGIYKTIFIVDQVRSERVGKAVEEYNKKFWKGKQEEKQRNIDKL